MGEGSESESDKEENEKAESLSTGLAYLCTPAKSEIGIGSTTSPEPVDVSLTTAFSHTFRLHSSSFIGNICVGLTDPSGKDPEADSPLRLGPP